MDERQTWLPHSKLLRTAIAMLSSSSIGACEVGEVYAEYAALSFVEEL